MSTKSITTRRLQLAGIINSFRSEDDSDLRKEAINHISKIYTINSSDRFIQNIGEAGMITLHERLPKVIGAHVLRLGFIKKEKKKIFRLERYAYAPELNVLEYKDGRSKRVPNCSTIDLALNSIYYQNMEEKQE